MYTISAAWVCRYFSAEGKHKIQIIVNHLRIMNPDSFHAGAGALSFTSLVHLRDLITQSSVLINSQHIIKYCNTVFKTTLGSLDLDAASL